MRIWLAGMEKACTVDGHGPLASTPAAQLSSSVTFEQIHLENGKEGFKNHLLQDCHT